MNMADKEHLRKVLSDAIPVLCRNGLPPSVTFRVEALIGITVIDEVGLDAAGEGNVTILSFQQTVSDNGVIPSRFGSGGSAAAVSNDETTASHTPRKRAKPSTVSVKQEYCLETSIKPEYVAESYPSHALGRPPSDNTYEEYGTGGGEELVGEDDEYVEDEDYYEDDGQYFDDGSGYPPGVKFEASDGAYVETADDDSYMQGEYMTEDYGQASVGRPPKSKVAKPRLSMPGSQPGAGRGKKPGGTARGGVRPRAGRMSQDQATAVALAAGATGSSNQRGMLTSLARTIAEQSEMSSKFFCHICNACLASKSSLVTHIKGSHLAASLFQCNQCGASFKWYMQLHRHRRRYHGNDADDPGDGSDYYSNEYLPETDAQ